MAGRPAHHDDGPMTGHPQEQRRHGLDGFFGWVRGLGLQRNTDDKWVAGVCSGAAGRLGVDPVLVRGVLLLLILFGGFGLTLYLLAWALLPDRSCHIVAEGGIRHGEGWGIALLTVIGIVIVIDLADRWWIWTILLPTAALVGWLVTSSSEGRVSEPMGKGTGYAGWSPAAASGFPSSGAAPTGAAPTGGAPTAPAAPYGMGPAPTAPAAPYGMGPGRTGTITPPAPRVIQKRRRRAGFLGLLLTVGLALAGFAAGSQAASRLSLTAAPPVLGLGAALAAAGLALVVIGLLGRSAGLAGFLATALAVVAVLGTVSSPELVRGGMGDRHWSLTQSTAASSFHLGMGEATLDLAGAGNGSTVEASVGMGELIIKVPAAAGVTVNPRLNAGDITVKRADGTQQKYHSDELPAALQVGSGTTTTTVNARVGMGTITIEEG